MNEMHILKNLIFSLLIELVRRLYIHDGIWSILHHHNSLGSPTYID
jgi:hypothetical protein